MESLLALEFFVFFEAATAAAAAAILVFAQKPCPNKPSYENEDGDDDNRQCRIALPVRPIHFYGIH